MAKCRGVNNQGSVCGKPTRYKSDFCNNHRSQDPSFTVCMGKQNSSGKPCIREAMVGELFCRAHLTQKGDLEKLQCPRGCGLLAYKLWNSSGYYYCEKCKGTMLDAKRLEAKLAEDLAWKFNHLLEGSTRVGKLKCPSCEGLMFGFKIVYVKPEGRGLGGNALGGDIGIGGAGLLGILVVVAVASAAASSANQKSEEDENEGDVMIIDGCKDCGTFWFDGKELNIVKGARSIRGATDWDIERVKSARKTSLGIQPSGRANNTNCLHVDERSGKKCRRVNYRGTEYCYMHQPN